MKEFDSSAWLRETLRLRGHNTPPSHLYKFLSLDENKSPFGLKNLNEILLNRRLYLSSPLYFNDISDCRLRLDFSGSEEDYMKMHKDIYARHFQVTPKEAKKKIRRINPSRKSTTDTLKKLIKNNVSDFGITCFTEYVSSPAQWAHYGDNHRGVAIEFKLDGFSEEFPAIPVRYVNNPPKLNLIKDNYGSLYLMGGYTKSDDWLYEKEWRIIKIDGADTYLDIPFDRITSVILGIDCHPTTEQTLIKINNKLEKLDKEPFKIRRARLSDDTYNITCET